MTSWSDRSTRHRFTLLYLSFAEGGGGSAHLAAWKILFRSFSFDGIDISVDDGSLRLFNVATVIGDISTTTLQRNKEQLRRQIIEADFTTLNNGLMGIVWLSGGAQNKSGRTAI